MVVTIERNSARRRNHESKGKVPDRTGRRSRGAIRAARLLVPTLVLLGVFAVVPPAQAATLFSENWSSYPDGWNPSGTGLSQDCGTGVSGCSLRMSPTATGSANEAFISNLATTWLHGTTTYSFWFEGDNTRGDTDSSFNLFLEPSDVWIHFTVTDGCCPSNNGFSTSIDNGGSSSSFGSWNSVNSWFHVFLVLDQSSFQYHVNVLDGSGNPVASSSNIAYPSSTTYVGLMDFETIFWGGTADTFHYDELVIDGPVAPSAPQNLQATPGQASISLSWQAPASDGGMPVTAYNLYRGTTSGGESYIGQVSSSVTSLTNVGLADRTTYYYKVTAVNGAGESVFSNEASATTQTLPTAPRSLAATGGVRQVSLSWQAPSDNGGRSITNYRIYRGTSSGGETLLTTVGNVLSYTNTALSSGVAYYYTVAAVTSLGTGPQSNEASATTILAAPNAPRWPSASSGPGAGEITVSWSSPSSDNGATITNYRVYRSTASGGFYTQIAELGNVFSFTDSGIPTGEQRYYYVTAVNSVGEGSQSAEVSAAAPVVPGAPQNLKADIQSNPGEVLLTWQAPASDGGSAVTGYRIYRGFQAGSETFFAQVGNQLSYTDTTCHVGRACFYVVAAVNAVGEGASSDEASATGTALPPDIPGIVEVVNDTDGDGFSNADELLGHSDPTNPASTPQTDDDCDGKTNAQEADVLAAQGIGHPVVSITGGGVTFDPNTLAASVDPPTVSTYQEGSSSC